MMPFLLGGFPFWILYSLVSVGSDSLCRDGAFVIICPLRPWSSNIGLPIWGDEIHGLLGFLDVSFVEKEVE